MGFLKYGSPEPGGLVDKEGHEKIWARLKKLGKKSVTEMTDEEKDKLEEEVVDKNKT